MSLRAAEVPHVKFVSQDSTLWGGLLLVWLVVRIHIRPETVVRAALIALVIRAAILLLVLQYHGKSGVESEIRVLLTILSIYSSPSGSGITTASGGNPTCVVCSPGYYSAGVRATCTACATGYFAGRAGASGCISCAGDTTCDPATGYATSW